MTLVQVVGRVDEALAWRASQYLYFAAYNREVSMMVTVEGGVRAPVGA